ncbi:SDR family oxidoreductase [Thiocapsa sp. UBA6158]|jgi:NAD(P)-dependent dehydrogenase (short-subunit alcohol dehydrogenase family)|uniref:SDR family oxidoreductase n=1 Tax=Thiocapsa sp. UBA6158 TaxID=1947692 RepID=UPI0025EF4DD2|nr:SDR family oxidoreductase [Thiocapsa sp. UBA6158]
MTDANRRAVLVTGANSGLGKALARAFARDGTRVGMLVRNEERGRAARDEILAATGNREIQLFVADLGNQREVRRAAGQILDRFERIDALINNAGTAYASRCMSPEGIERSFAVNHLGPFLLTSLLLERIKSSAPARIVNVGTKMETAIDFDDLDWTRRRYRMMQAYGQSKLGNLHFTFELARRLAGTGVTVNCVFPGIFRSNLGGSDGAQGVFWKAVDLLLGRFIPTPTRAAERVLYATRSPDLDGVTGRYLGDRCSIKAPAQALDPEANRRLWAISGRLVGFSQDPAASSA